MNRAGLALVALAAGALAGCPTDPPPVDAGDGGLDAPDGASCPATGRDESVNAELVLGTGRDGTLEDFRPLAPGDPVWITPGEQGLQHVTVAFRGRNFDPTLPLIEATLVRADDCESVGYLRYRTRFVADPLDPTRLAVQAVRVTMLDDEDRYEYCTVLGRDATLVVNVSDMSGNRAHREMRVRIAGIDPAVRADLREAWLRACDRLDGGARD